MPLRKNHLFGWGRSKPNHGSVPADLTVASDFSFCFQCKVGSAIVAGCSRTCSSGCELAGDSECSASGLASDSLAVTSFLFALLEACRKTRTFESVPAANRRKFSALMLGNRRICGVSTTALDHARNALTKYYDHSWTDELRQLVILLEHAGPSQQAKLCH